MTLAEPIRRAARTQRSCPHHWMIEPARGPVSRGTCRHCGTRRKFRNSVEASAWGGEDRRLRPAPRSVDRLAQPIGEVNVVDF